MAKTAPKIDINLDLLKPQSQSQKLLVKLFHWVLSAGRFIIVVVEVVVLLAFLARFKFDADIASTKEEIAQQIPFIESLKSDEILIRQAQFQIATIKKSQQNSPSYTELLLKIANQTPLAVTLSNLNIESAIDKVNIKITGVAQNNNDLTTFILGLKSDQSFHEVNLSNVTLEQGIINFSITLFSDLKGVTKL